VQAAAEKVEAEKKAVAIFAVAEKIAAEQRAVEEAADELKGNVVSSRQSRGGEGSAFAPKRAEL
jgi:membrane protein involved in colicin uptake